LRNSSRSAGSAAKVAMSSRDRIGAWALAPLGSGKGKSHWMKSCVPSRRALSKARMSERLRPRWSSKAWR
jgi:hypothetical protein